MGPLATSPNVAALLAPLFVAPDQGGPGFYKPWLFLRSFAPCSGAICVHTSDLGQRP